MNSRSAMTWHRARSKVCVPECRANASPCRGRDAAFVDAIAGQETLHAQNHQRICVAVPLHDRVDELVATPEQLLVFPLDRPCILLSVKFCSGTPGPGQAAMQSFDHNVRFVGGLFDGLLDGVSSDQIRRLVGPVLGKQGDECVGQIRFDMEEKRLQRSRALGDSRKWFSSSSR